MTAAEHGRQDRERARLELIGAIIRSARKARSMTLEDLSAAVGLSVAFLSRLERGRIACSIGNLLEIAGVLQLSPAELFSDAADGARAQAYRVVRAAHAEPQGGVPMGPYAWRQLASGRGEQRMEAFLLDLPARSRETPLVTHPGEEFCFVIEGAVEFQIGEEVIALAEGDSIHLRSDVPHMAWAKGASAARLLMVTAIENQSATAVEWWAQITTARRTAVRREPAKGSPKHATAKGAKQ